MELSTVICIASEATVTQCHDEGKTFSERRVRLDFGDASLFVTCGDIPKLRDDLLSAMRECFEDALAEENEWIERTASELAD